MPLSTSPVRALAEAASACDEIERVLAPALTGTADPDVQWAVEQVREASAAITELCQRVEHTHSSVNGFVDRLRGTASVAIGPSLEDTEELGRRITQAQQRVGRSPVGTSPALGEWVRSDGWSIRMCSGVTDEYYQAVLAFVSDRLRPDQRGAARLASHIEVKVAIQMCLLGLREETVVVDRSVCGTRDFDRAGIWTCDKQLSQREGGPMTLTAYGPIYHNGIESGFTRSLATVDDIRALVALLGEPGVLTATIEGRESTLDVHVQAGFGYLHHNGPETFGVYSVGDPASPAVTDSELGFPEGSGVPLSTFTAALTEFLDTEAVPTTVRWQSVHTVQETA